MVKNKWLNVDFIYISLLWYFMKYTVNVLFMNNEIVICVNPSERCAVLWRQTTTILPLGERL